MRVHSTCAHFLLIFISSIQNNGNFNLYFKNEIKIPIFYVQVESSWGLAAEHLKTSVVLQTLLLSVFHPIP